MLARQVSSTIQDFSLLSVTGCQRWAIRPQTTQRLGSPHIHRRLLTSGEYLTVRGQASDPGLHALHAPQAAEKLRKGRSRGQAVFGCEPIVVKPRYHAAMSRKGSDRWICAGAVVAHKLRGSRAGSGGRCQDVVGALWEHCVDLVPAPGSIANGE